MAHYTLIARINAGNGRFPFVNVQFRKAHRPIPIAGATYYLRRSGGARTPIRIGKDLAAAHAALLHMDDREVPNEVREVTLRTPSNKPVGSQRKTVVDELESTSNAANRSHARHTLATAQPSISLPRAVKRRISMRFAGTTCSTTAENAKASSN
jgi:hypothetical protein